MLRTSYRTSKRNSTQSRPNNARSTHSLDQTTLDLHTSQEERIALQQQKQQELDTIIQFEYNKIMILKENLFFSTPYILID